MANASLLDPANVDLLMKLAATRRGLRDTHGALAAVAQALTVDPLAFVPLLMKASLLEALGDRQQAADMYEAALFHAPDASELSPMLVRQIDHARAVVADQRRVHEAELAARTAGVAAQAGADVAARIDRFRSNAVRRTRVYHSDPSDFHYPGLVEREFHERSSVPWLAGLEAEIAAITAEFQALVQSEHAELVPYVQYPDDVPLRQWKALNHSRDWTAIHLLRDGRRVEANARHCARTLAALSHVPQPAIPGRSPNAMFSLLTAGTRIPPHTGVANTRLVCHLPLIVPAGCWFRVGATTREWHVGEGFVFDDTIEHEAANEGSQLRVVLIVDVWHPGLSPIERDAVSVVIGMRDVDTGL